MSCPFRLNIDPHFILLHLEIRRRQGTQTKSLDFACLDVLNSKGGHVDNGGTGRKYLFFCWTWGRVVDMV